MQSLDLVLYYWYWVLFINEHRKQYLFINKFIIFFALLAEAEEYVDSTFEDG